MNDTQQIHLRQRIEHLESVNRWHISALELLTSMGELHGDTNYHRDPSAILDIARSYVQRLFDFEVVAFLTCNEIDSDFDLTICDPNNATDIIKTEINYLIDSGKFAWAINQNRPLVERSTRTGGFIILHVLASKTRVRGMFLGTLSGNPRSVDASRLNLLSLILFSSAYALESAALYKLISDHNRDLEIIVEQRTEELEQNKLHDALTGLPNRVLFQDRTCQAIERAHRYQTMVAILLFDIDNFKRINDTLGHAAGDLLLKELAQRLKSIVRNSDTVGRPASNGYEEITVSRLGGDEFSVLLADIVTVDSVMKVAQRIAECFTQPFVMDRHEIMVTTSIGISIFPSDETDPEALLKNADIAMYHVKEQGRNSYEFFSRTMQAKYRDQLMLENELHHALERNELCLYYQPKVDAISGTIRGVEALLRWIHPERGMIPPNLFISVAEQNGLILPIGDWVIDTACAQLRQWQDQGIGAIEMAVNLSARQARQPDLARKIQIILERHNLSAHHLELEITESLLMDGAIGTTANLRNLIDAGIRLSLDDFGTGYSNLGYLKRFPVNVIKIDISFVRDIAHSQADFAIVNAIVALAHGLGMSVVAEGVEYQEQLELLKKLGCDTIQGYLFSRPLPAEKVTVLLAMGIITPSPTA
ncbi:diguanylate cyclase [Gammaproteobacteria bacterium]